MSALPVLYEDNHLLVVNKPAGLATMGATTGTETAVTWAARYLKNRYQKPGNVFVGVVSRIDRLVSGVLVLARTSKSASRLSEQLRERTTEKRYVAWVEGHLAASNWVELSDWVIKDEAFQRMRVADESTSDAQLAKLRIRTLAHARGRTQLSIELLSGRKHQIRLQLAHQGHPILGDWKYDAVSKFPLGIALHCQQMTIQHPTRKEPLSFIAPPPDYWP